MGKHNLFLLINLINNKKEDCLGMEVAKLKLKFKFSGIPILDFELMYKSVLDKDPDAYGFIITLQTEIPGIGRINEIVSTKKYMHVFFAGTLYNKVIPKKPGEPRDLLIEAVSVNPNIFCTKEFLIPETESIIRLGADFQFEKHL